MEDGQREESATDEPAFEDPVYEGTEENNFDDYFDSIGENKLFMQSSKVPR